MLHILCTYHTSCGGTSYVLVRRSTRAYASIHGKMKNIPENGITMTLRVNKFCTEKSLSHSMGNQNISLNNNAQRSCKSSLETLFSGVRCFWSIIKIAFCRVCVCVWKRTSDCSNRHTLCHTHHIPNIIRTIAKLH